MCGGIGSICKKDSTPDTGDGIVIPPNADRGPSLFENLSREDRDHRVPAIPGVTGRRRRIRRLHSRTGFDVAVYPNGKVRGTQSPKNKYGTLIKKQGDGNFEFEIAGENGEMRIKGVITGFYITMTPKGRIVGQPQPDINGTVWIETRASAQSAYMSFLSRDYAHYGWYFAIKKSGKPKAGHKTNHPYPQKSISFLSYIVSEEFY